jgi:type IV pilus assembly protein PilM
MNSVNLSNLFNSLPIPARRTSKTPKEIVAMDLGSRTTKAVHLERGGTDFLLRGYTCLDSPAFGGKMSSPALVEHLKTVAEHLGADTRVTSLVLGGHDTVVRVVETPMLSMDELRPVLKYSAKQYLQQELPGYTFDGHIILYFNGSDAGKPAQVEVKRPKQRVLVVGIKSQLLQAYVEGAKAAGLIPFSVVPGLVGPVNAAERAMPGPFSVEAIAIVDVGFQSSTICILKKGEFVLSRVVTIGGDRLTTALAESMKISYAEADGIKIGMASEVRSDLEAALLPLGRELRASIDYFEHNHDQSVNRVLLCGGTAQSDLVREILESELMVPCEKWDPTVGLHEGASAQQAAEMANVAPQFAVAVGAALGAL